MNIQSFLEHHGILRNPFAEEDAQTDPVFKDHCISSAYHPVWDKVYGDPSEPSTAIVFGPKGSGKTAMRLQIDRHLSRYNQYQVANAARYSAFLRAPEEASPIRGNGRSENTVSTGTSKYSAIRNARYRLGRYSPRSR
jgi:hypothetical protein